MNTSEVLNKAADLIEERGWTQGAMGWSNAGPLCLEGGVMAAAGVSDPENVLECPAYAAVMTFLADDTRWGFFKGALYDWNDVRNRTAAEVIAVLRAAAVIEQAREEQAAREQVPA